MNEKKYIIEVSHVNKNFKNNKVLKDVTLRCESGRIYGLVGHNGSGKTVLFIALRLLLFSASSFSSASIGFLFTSFPLGVLPHMH